jgi:hypothetical protein
VEWQGPQSLPLRVLTMPRAIPVALRQTLLQRHLQGESLQAIALDLGLSFWTVRHLWRRYRCQPSADCAPAYPRCARSDPRTDRRMIRAAVFLKRRHPSWGAVLISLQLRQKWPDRPVPHE